MIWEIFQGIFVNVALISTFLVVEPKNCVQTMSYLKTFCPVKRTVAANSSRNTKLLCLIPFKKLTEVKNHPASLLHLHNYTAVIHQFSYFRIYLFEELPFRLVLNDVIQIELFRIFSANKSKF